jgi:hypothetical protein
MKGMIIIANIKQKQKATEKVIETKYTCITCDLEADGSPKQKNKSAFYVSYNPLYKAGITSICKDCANKLAQVHDKDGNPTGEYTQDSIMYALELLDKPLLQKLYDGVLQESSADSGKNYKNLLGLYIKNVQMKDYKELRWRDSDIFDYSATKVEIKPLEEVEKDEAKELAEMYRANKKSVIRALRYDPFLSEPEKDKPFLYGRLSGMLDDTTTDDMFKTGACVEIVKDYNHAEKLNDIIGSYIQDRKEASKNSGVIKNLSATKKDLINQALSLAKDNGISVNNNKNASKGGTTLSGKLNYLNSIGFRDAKINMFDINTSEGMRQVAEISAKAQVDQIGFDDNTFETIQNIRRDVVDECQKDRDLAVETARKLMLENKDLKNFLIEKGLINEASEVIDQWA